MPRLIPFPFNAKQQAALRTCLSQGEVLAFPTETAFALGGNALEPKACARVMQLKQRGREKPLLLLVQHAQEAATYCAKMTAPIQALMQAFWPGRLTLVVEAAGWVPETLCNPNGGVALRVSPAPEVTALRALSQGPLIGTSANLSGQTTCYSAQQVLARFAGQSFGVIQGELPALGRVSTVVDVSQSVGRVLRCGAITRAQIAEVIPMG